MMFSTLRGKLRPFVQRPWADRRLLTEAYFWLGVARLALLTLPFRWIAPFLGTTKLETIEDTLAHDEKSWLNRVSWAVRTASRYTPWTSNCLPQAIAAKRLLQQRHIRSTLYLGLRHSQESPGEMEAHAWLRSGKFVIVGGRGEQRFTVVATFAEEKLSLL